MTIRMRSALMAILLSLLMVCGAVTAAAQPAQRTAREPVTIGAILDLSGPFKSFGLDIRASLALAQSQLNAHGGINGSRIKLVIKDSSGVPDQAVIAERDLADQGAVAILGPISSGEAEVAFAQASQLHIPVITGTANKPGITGLGRGWAFRDTATNSQLFGRTMPLFKKKYNVTKAALIYDDKQPVFISAATGPVPAAAQALKIDIGGTYTISTGQADYTSVVQQVKNVAGLNGLFVMTAPVEAGLIARELDRQGVHVPVLGHTAQNSDAFRTTAGSSLGTWVVPSIFWAPAVKSGAAFLKALQRFDPNPTPVPEVATYYDSLNIVVAAARAAHVTASMPASKAREAIRQGLLKTKNYRGVAGPTTFLPTGDVDKHVYPLLITKGGATLLKLK